MNNSLFYVNLVKNELNLLYLISTVNLLHIHCFEQPFGQTFISDDFFLSAVGASAAVCNTVCRILVGHLKDMTTYKVSQQ